ncbi:MAG: M48 family metallopeptidase [Candidatus Omnitrophica bacterium]|nr:M48 family metallopeptidase [Candidatus Omnitrophota bacterium]
MRDSLYIENIGDIPLVKSKKARRIIISLCEGKKLKITVPYWLSYGNAKKAILSSDAGWIRTYLSKIEKWKKTHNALPRSKESLTREEACQKLTLRAKEIARENGFLFGKISVKEQKTRWGSCSPGNNISLNLKLRRLPDLFIDYVILHELVHTRVKNHKKEFWEEMGKYMQCPRDIDRQLRRYSIAFL